MIIKVETVVYYVRQAESAVQYKQDHLSDLWCVLSHAGRCGDISITSGFQRVDIAQPIGQNGEDVPGLSAEPVS